MNALIIAIVILIMLLAIIGLVVFYFLSDRNADISFVFKGEDRFETPGEIELKRRVDGEWLDSRFTEEYSIINSDGLILKAHLLRSEIPSKHYVLGVHGYRGTGFREFRTISKFYHNLGVNMFMPDHRASGDSQGRFITYGAKEAPDIRKWIDFMIKEFGEDITISLHGVSMGSAIVMLLNGMNLPKQVKFSVSDCGYSNLKEELCFELRELKTPYRLCYMLYRLASIIIAHYDPSKVRPIDAIRLAQTPVIFAHGLCDQLIPYEMSEQVFAACGCEDKKHFAAENARHTESFERSSEYRNEIAGRIQDCVKACSDK